MARALRAIAAAALATGLLPTLPMFAQQAPQGPPASVPGAIVAAAVRHDQSPPLRDIPTTMEEMPGRRSPGAAPPSRPQEAPGFRNPVCRISSLSRRCRRRRRTSTASTTRRRAPARHERRHRAEPLRPVGEPVVAVYEKTGRRYTARRTEHPLHRVGGPCETTNDGDPIVLYDELADRWMLSQFALPNYPSGPFYQCIAVSTTQQPHGRLPPLRVLVRQDERLPEVRRVARRLLHGDQPVRRRQPGLGRRGRRGVRARRRC